jgi:hypothetical protein
VILFCDIERPLRWAPMVALNRGFARVVIAASATRKRPGERIGTIGAASVLRPETGCVRSWPPLNFAPAASRPPSN